MNFARCLFCLWRLSLSLAFLVLAQSATAVVVAEGWSLKTRR